MVVKDCLLRITFFFDPQFNAFKYRNGLCRGGNWRQHSHKRFTQGQRDAARQLRLRIAGDELTGSIVGEKRKGVKKEPATRVFWQRVLRHGWRQFYRMEWLL